MGEVEAALLSHESVRDCVVVARAEAGGGGARLVGYVVAEAGRTAGAAELRAHLRAGLPDYMVPAAIVELDALPLTPNGKVDRKALPAPEAVNEHADEAGAMPSTQAEELLAGIWADVLGLPQVGVTQNFFELGGHSLLATQVVSRVRKAFGVDLPLRMLFESPTVEGLARALGTAHGVEAPPLAAVERGGPLPLSFAQQRLWFLNQLEPGNPFYNIPSAARLEGRLDVAALEQTLTEIVRRHEALRTTFASEGGEPVQLINPAEPLTLPVTDLSALPEVEREAEARRLVQEEALRPFDLAASPLLRASLLRLAEEEHIALFTMHHIVSDGWSMGVLIREVASLYEAYTAGQESPLEELSIQYADYAYWQRAWLQGDALERQLDYWREELADAPALLQLPTDRPRPAVQTFNGANQPFILSPQLSEALKELSRREGATLYMTLMAAFQALLHRYTGQGDILVGSPIANRNRGETEALIGFFVNTLVLRGRVVPGESFRGLLRQVRERTLGAYAHQDVPFEKLVEELRPERSLSHSPLFQVMMVWQNTPREEPGLGGLRLSPVGGESATAKFDLHLAMSEGAGGEVRGVLEYNTDLFDAETVGRMVSHFERLLAAVAADPEQAVGELPLLSHEERSLLLAEWNDTAAAYPSDKSIHRLFEEQAARTPDAVALVFGDVELTYAELNGRANQLAHYLQSLGVGPESLVGVMMERSPEMVLSLLGVLKAGGAYVPFEPTQPSKRLAAMAEDARPSVLLTQESLRAHVPAGVEGVVCLDAEWAEVERQGAHNPTGGVVADNCAYVIYTSGSTGRPKGVAITHRSAVAFIAWAAETFPAEDFAGVLASTSISFDLSVFELFATLARGGRVILVENALQLASAGAAEGVTLINTVPSAMAELVRMGAVPESVRVVNLAGEALKNQLAQGVYEQTAVERVYNLYGPSEDTTYSTYTLVERGARREPTIGRPVSNTRAYVLDRYMQPVPVGVAGELHVGGAGLARGYLNRPNTTAEKFIPDPFSQEPGARLYRTGDLARFLPDGDIEFLGRVDFQIKLRGFRIELGEIEAALASHPAVREAVAVVREDGGDKRLVAYLVADAPAPAAELRQYLRERVPDYMVPSAFVLLEGMPLNANGKVDRKALPAPGVEMMGRAYTAPRTPVEEELAGIWAEVLRVERVGVEDNFFELGGHSLMATQIVSRVRKALGVDLPLRMLFESPTVEGLARHVEAALSQSRADSAPPLVAREPGAPLPLSFGQQRMWFLNWLEPNNAFYNIPIALRMRGPLDAAALARAFEQIVERHEVLRTRIVEQEGEPVQVLMTAAEALDDLPVVDLSHLGADEREAEARRLAQEEVRRPFDLAAKAPVRCRLLRLADDEHVVLFTMHHIASDEWSGGVLVRELGLLYDAYTGGVEAALRELPIQYADYAAWQREWLQGEVLDSQLGYWRRQLGGATTLELPTDRPRAARAGGAAGRRTLKLSAELSEGLKELSEREGATLFMTLLAAFDVLLARYAGQSDVVVGTPIANRHRAETEGLIGLFLNTLVLRTDLSGDPTFREVLGRVRETALGAYAHQDVPFEMLVEDLRPGRDMSRHPLFDVMFIVQREGGERLKLRGLEMEPLGVRGETARFDLTSHVRERGDGLWWTLAYRAGLFDEATIERMLKHLGRVLEEIVANPAARVHDLELVCEEERAQLLAGWNETGMEYERETGVEELFGRQAARTPAATALIFGDEQLSYAELNERANQLAHYLRSLGVGPDVLVGVMLERSAEMVVSVLAVLKAGGAYVPLDPQYPQERLSFMLADSGAQVLLTQESLAGLLPAESLNEELRVVALDDAAELLSRQPTADVIDGGATAENLAYVIYTSGSTGRPKGVMVSRRALSNFIAAMRQQFEPTPEDCLLAVTTLSFDIAGLELYLPLTTGCRLWLASREEAADGERLMGLLEQGGVTLMQATPATWRMLLDAGWAGDPRLRALCGGEALPGELAERLAERVGRLENMYGPTETTIWSTADGVEPGAGRVTIGRPIANTQVYVLDGRLGAVPVGVAGELYIGGEGVARGYLNRAELTAERFVPDPFAAEAGARLYRTGDLVRYLADGRIEYLGRIDQQVKVRGYRIELGEIEAALCGHESVKECAVAAREYAGGERRLVAYVVTGGDERRAGVERGGLSAELRRHLLGRLPEYMVPGLYVELEALPLTPNGKVDRKALPAPEASRRAEELVLPRTPAEELLAGIWREVLGAAEVGVTDNFFELGGDSILSIRIISKANRAGLRLSPRQIFQHQTIAELAEAARLSSPDLETSGGAAGEVVLTPAQQRLLEQQPEEALDRQAHVLLLQLEPHVDAEGARRLVGELWARHDALRLRFVPQADGWAQTCAGADAPPPFEVIDLSGEPKADRQGAVERKVSEARSGLNISAGSPVSFTYFSSGAEAAGRLLVVAHKLVCDELSLRILTDDLRAAQARPAGGGVSPRGPQTASYSYWAQRLQELAQSEEADGAGAYWLEQDWSEVSPLPLDGHSGEGDEAAPHAVTNSFDAEETQFLLEEMPDFVRAQVDDALLAALARAFAYVTDESSLLVEVSRDGRSGLFEDEDADWSNAVGAFTIKYPLLLETDISSSAGDALKMVKEQAAAGLNRGLGYDLLRGLRGGAEVSERLRALPRPEVGFGFRRTTSGAGPEGGGYLVEVSAGVVDERLRVEWHFDARVSRATGAELAREFVRALRAVIDYCKSPDAGLHTPSDFAAARLGQDELDKFLASLGTAEVGK
ncbi:MAG TPA: amino acid adenylation domain-containing protein [Pyrinomonadaceae bacterium]|nr:amino acid adenylation domain-containing protein [Pyrinomonadaceae bacterium]